MVKFNNPLQDILDITNEYLNGKNVYIQFDPDLGLTSKGPFGETSQDENNYIVTISGNISIINCVEILAHELAHVISGLENEHNKKWETTFQFIFDEYNKLIESKEKIKEKQNGK